LPPKVGKCKGVLKAEFDLSTKITVDPSFFEGRTSDICEKLLSSIELSNNKDLCQLRKKLTMNLRTQHLLCLDKRYPVEGKA